MLLSSDYVTSSEKPECHPGQSEAIIEAASASVLARSLALKRLAGGLAARAYFVVTTWDIPNLRTMARSGSPCLLTLCNRPPACLLSLSGRPVQRVANRLSCTTLSPDAHSFGNCLFLMRWLQ